LIFSLYIQWYKINKHLKIFNLCMGWNN